MKLADFLSSSLILFLFTANAYSQQGGAKEISGRVLERSGKPLEYAVSSGTCEPTVMRIARRGIQARVAFWYFKPCRFFS